MASNSPKELAEFYSVLINAELKKGFSNQDFFLIHPDGLKINIYKPSSKDTLSKPGEATSLCINALPNEQPLSYLKDWINELLTIGAKILGKPKEEIFGAEAWMQDPEGNRFLILVPKQFNNQN